MITKEIRTPMVMNLYPGESSLQQKELRYGKCEINLVFYFAMVMVISSSHLPRSASMTSTIIVGVDTPEVQNCHSQRLKASKIFLCKYLCSPLV